MGRHFSLAAVCALAAVLSGCAGGRTPIRIGVNAWPPCEIWYVAQDRGYFGDLPVQIVRFSAWSDNMAALYRGNVDLTHSTYFNALYCADKGEKGRIILVSDTLLGGDGLAVKNAVGAGGALKGRSVAVEINTDEHFLLHKALEYFGLTEDDVEIVPSTSEEAKDLFVSGNVDACSTYEPYLSEAASAGAGRVIWTTRDLPGYMIDVLVARDGVLSKRLGDFAVLLSAWYRAQDYLRSHGADAFPSLAAKEGMGAQDFAAFYNSFTFFDAVENRRIFGSAGFVEKLGEIDDFLFLHKATNSRTDIASIFTPRVVESLK